MSKYSQTRQRNLRRAGSALTPWIVGNLIALAGATAAAQTPDTNPAATSSEEIVVTARRREEVIQDVPASIFAVTGEGLEQAGIDGVDDLDQLAAGLSISGTNPGASVISMRGISSLGGGVNAASAVGYYIDEAPMSAFAAGMPEVALFDAQRVEVLRGPQGTLFGESSMGGTIRVIMNVPDATVFSGRVQANWASVEDGESGATFRGVLNVPLIEDELALRISGNSQDILGWVDSPDLGQEDANDGTQRDVRGALRWTPGQRFTLDLSYLRQELETGEFYATEPGLYRPSDLSPLLLNPTQQSRREQAYDLYNATATYDFGAASLVASVSHFDQEYQTTLDQTPYMFLFFGTPGTSVGAGTQFIDSTIADVRLVSNGDNRFNWTLGAYFKDDDRGHDDNGFTISIPAFAIVDDQSLTDLDANINARALYADLEFNINDTFAIELGGRYYEADYEQLVTEVTTSAIFGTLAGRTQPSEGSASDFSPRVGLNWTPNDNVLVYAHIADGFRDGGANYTPPLHPEIPASFGSEQVRSYEIGVKSTPMPWLTANAAIYRNDWTDLQLSFISNDGLYGFIDNAGEARAFGAELEIAARPTDGLTLGLNLSTIEATIQDDVFNAFNLLVVTGGNSVPLTPRFQGAATLSYDFPLTGGFNGLVSGAYSYRSSTFSEPQNRDTERNPAQGNLNLRGGVYNEFWSINLFVNNATDSQDSTYRQRYIAALPFTLGNFQQPRTIGVELNASF